MIYQKMRHFCNRWRIKRRCQRQFNLKGMIDPGEHSDGQ